MMLRSLPLFLLLLACEAAQPQSTKPRPVGGPCEGCEAIFEYGDRPLRTVDTLPDFHNADEKLLLHGTVYAPDGHTPAAGVILYIYQTNRAGIYPIANGAEGWARRHGYLRGWVQTGADGRYAFYTFRPGPYPGRSEPAHIHLTVKEKKRNEYYLDDFLFDDDPLLTAAYRQQLGQRGGSGIVQPERRGALLVARRDIILGHRIPHYK